MSGEPSFILFYLCCCCKNFISLTLPQLDLSFLKLRIFYALLILFFFSSAVYLLERGDEGLSSYWPCVSCSLKFCLRVYLKAVLLLYIRLYFTKSMYCW